MKFTANLVITFLFLIMISSCDKDDLVTTTDGSFSMTINNTAFSGEMKSDYDVINLLENTYEGFDISFQQSTRSSAIYKEVRFNFAKYNSTQIEEGDEFFSGNVQNAGTNPYFFAQGAYTELDMQSNAHYGVTDTFPGDAYVKITKLDRANSRISGTFYFKATDEDTNIEYNVENGIFNNLEY